MENENKDALSSEKSPKNQPLQLLQHNDAKFIACDLRSRDLVKCRSCLTPFCEKPIKVYHNSRNYLACSIKRSLSENSTRSLPTNGTLKPNKKLSKSLRHWYDYQGCASLCKTSKKVIKGIRLSVLIEHNKYRKLHGAGPLKMDYQLSIYAQEWADHLAEQNLLETRPHPIYGENIMCVRRSLFNVEQIIKLWYQEKYNYDYLKPGFDLYTGHFTQIVWWETEFLGVGVASNDTRICIVCNYNPPGNINGHFQKNVLPRKLLIESNMELPPSQDIKT